MSPATPPELDIARVHSWCRRRVPDGLHDELRIECDVDARQVTIYEARLTAYVGALRLRTAN